MLSQIWGPRINISHFRLEIRFDTAWVKTRRFYKPILVSAERQKAEVDFPTLKKRTFRFRLVPYKRTFWQPAERVRV